jgi:phosphoglycerol transferase MdoB-like AlkP superfamily enzyme
MWALLFVLQKPIFLAIYGTADSGLADTFSVIYHGLSLDFSMAGYLTVLPGLILLVSALPFRRGRVVLVWAVRVVFALSALVAALAFVANIALYGYWQFPLDSTPIFFIVSSPSAAMASVVWWQALLGIVATAIFTVAIYIAFYGLWNGDVENVLMSKGGKMDWLPLLLLNASLFLPIRGGITVSTMNTGKAYFSQHMLLNHAAVNPLFSFMESITHQEDWAHMYRFMDDKKAHRLAEAMLPKLRGEADSVSTLRPAAVLNDSMRVDGHAPDIYIVFLESFSDTLTKQRDVTPNLNRLKREGVYFRNFYANGFRTDRGLVSVLLGYPAPGALSLMKYPKKTAHITSLAAMLKANGYASDLRYYYGGDADFTNMRSFLVNQGFKNITSDVNFPISERLSKWGVPDHLVFKKAEEDLTKEAESGLAKERQDEGKPTFTVIQTSSSHEPFDVPYHRLSDKVFNAFAYTDNCIGQFVNFLKKSGRWQRSLVIFIPDHLGAWPKDADSFAAWRYHIPMVWVGGAIKRPMVVDTFGSQQDIAATVLGELGIANSSMAFSKDLFDGHTPHYAYFMMNDGFGIKNKANEVIYDNKQQKVIVSKGKEKGRFLRYGQALLQVLFDDIAKR